MKYRKLRIAWSVVWGLVAVLLCSGWAFALIFSEFAVNRLNAAKVVTTIAFNRGNVTYARTDMSKLPSNSFVLSRNGQRIESSTSPFGWKFGLSSSRPTNHNFLWQSSSASLALQAPYWILDLFAASLAGLPWISRRLFLKPC
jgi:hypothetical protein